MVKYFFILTTLSVFSKYTEGTVPSPLERNIGQTRIIGGQSAFTHQFPFAAAIYVETVDSKFFCGGALYGQQWIITAGQCVDGAILFKIQLGSSSLERADPNRVTVATSEYILHPDYNSATLKNDIAIIKLRIPIEFTDFIKPITALAMDELADQTYVRAIGWGQTSDRNSALATELNYVYVSSLSNTECQITYGNQITNNMVCIEGNYNQGTCHGDTGSPLVDSYGRYDFVHAGVASFISGNGCESTDPSGYTRTYPYVNWINNVTANN